MTPIDFNQTLRAYAELTVKVGLNLQPGQRLLIIGPLANGGVSLEAAPLVRHIAGAAYAAGAQLVEPIWGDEALQAARYRMRPAIPSMRSPRGCRKRSSITRLQVMPCSRSTRTIRIS